MNDCLFKFLGKGKMETFWLTGKIDNESIQGNLTRVPKMVHQISFSGTKDDHLENVTDCKEQKNVIKSYKLTINY